MWVLANNAKFSLVLHGWLFWALGTIAASSVVKALDLEGVELVWKSRVQIQLTGSEMNFIAVVVSST